VIVYRVAHHDPQDHPDEGGPGAELCDPRD
jgi:hypothetical protein